MKGSAWKLFVLGRSAGRMNCWLLRSSCPSWLARWREW